MIQSVLKYARLFEQGHTVSVLSQNQGYCNGISASHTIQDVSLTSSLHKKRIAKLLLKKSGIQNFVRNGRERARGMILVSPIFDDFTQLMCISEVLKLLVMAVDSLEQSA